MDDAIYHEETGDVPVELEDKLKEQGVDSTRHDPIVLYPSDVLYKSCKALPEDTGDLVARMRKAMQVRGGIGLAANQIGLSYRAALIDVGENGTGEHVLIDPELVELSGPRVRSVEGCLSCPSARVEVPRRTIAKVAYNTLEGERTTTVFEGLEAFAVQHEVDHLNGKLIVRFMTHLKRDIYKRRLGKTRRVIRRRLRDTL